MGLAKKIKNTLNHLPHVLGAINFGTILDGIASTADTAAAGVTEVNAAVTDLQTYSETPVQIGTWIDGTTPVWRWAHKIKCKTDMTSGDYGTLREGEHIELALPTVAESNVLILNATCTLCTSVDAPSLSDDYSLQYNETIGPGHYSFVLTYGFGVIPILPEDYADLNGEGFIVYAEFVTPASNIAEPEVEGE